MGSPQATACSMQRAPAWARACDESVLDRPGASSGRQRKQGLKPPSSAAAALPKKRQFSALGSFTRQTGRQ